jgi:hypothetical protein
MTKNDSSPLGYMAPPEFPRLELPTIFADGVVNILPSKEVVKFYLSRFDPPIVGDANLLQRVIAQVAMPTTAFVQTAVFFQVALNHLVDEGYVSKTEVEALFKQSEHTSNDTSTE